MNFSATDVLAMMQFLCFEKLSLLIKYAGLKLKEMKEPYYTQYTWALLAIFLFICIKSVYMYSVHVIVSKPAYLLQTSCGKFMH